MAPSTARYWLIGAAGLVVAAVWFWNAPRMAAERISPPPAEPARPGGATAAVDDPLPLDKLRQARFAPAATDAFPTKTWAAPPPPPPKPVAAVAPPKPVAPPLPFTFLGQMSTGEEPLVFLTRDGRVYSVAEGDVLDHTYRIESIVAGRMTLVYLPLNLRQSLSIGTIQ